MTLFGWDTSHYDWDRGPMDVAAARRDGVVFFTAKIGEGSSNTDPRFADGVRRARDAGIEFVGAYYVLHSANPTGQADRCVALADKLAPWWRDYPGWFWQGDFEHWPDDFPPPAACKAFCDRLASATGRQVVAYASRGQYGSTLAGIGRPLWNADYGVDASGHYTNVYPGDGYRGWTAYSGQVPALLQYSSKARIGTQPTCDANAFRGSYEDLRKLLTGGTVAGCLTSDDPGWLDTVFRVDSILRMTDPTARTGEPNDLAKAIRAIATQAVANGSALTALNAKIDQTNTKIDQLAAKIDEIAAAGGPSNAPVLAAISDLADDVKSLRGALGEGAASTAQALEAP